MVCRVMHALFGLRQASCAWDAQCYTLLWQLKFRRSTSDPSPHMVEHVSTFLVFYVDGFITGVYRGYKSTKEHVFAPGVTDLGDATLYQRLFGLRMDFNFLVDLLDGFLSYPKKTHRREFCGFGICIPHKLTGSCAGHLDNLEIVPFLDR